MIAVDTDILVYAHREEMPLHAVALGPVAIAGGRRCAVGAAVFCIGEFVRVVTHPRIFHPATDLDTALAFLDQLLGSPSARILTPGSTFPAVFAEACRDGGVQGNLAFDAQLVAVCREHGVADLLTEDRDFARFDTPRPVRLEA